MTNAQLEYQRRWRKSHQASCNDSKRRWLKSKNGRRWRRNYSSGYAKKNRAKLRANGKRERDKLRLEVLTVYGGDPPRCAGCGERRLPCLTLDHPKGDGATERRAEHHKGGTQQYRRLKAAGFPPGYRVLCWNCNCGGR